MLWDAFCTEGSQAQVPCASEQEEENKGLTRLLRDQRFVESEGEPCKNAILFAGKRFVSLKTR